MQAELRYQPSPNSDYVLVMVEVTDDLDNPLERMIEALSLTIRNHGKQEGPFSVVDGKLIPVRDTLIQNN